MYCGRNTTPAAPAITHTLRHRIRHPHPITIAMPQGLNNTRYIQRVTLASASSAKARANIYERDRANSPCDIASLTPLKIDPALPLISASSASLRFNIRF